MFNWLRLPILVAFFLATLLIVFKPVFAQKPYDWPLDQTRSGQCTSGSIKVSIESRVSKNKDTNEYSYWYKISNTGEETALVGWENIDRILTLSWATPHIFTIGPGKFEEFTLKIKEPPLSFNGKLSVFEYANPLSEDTKKLMKEEVGVTVETTSTNVLRGSFRCGQSGPLPDSSLRR